MLTRSSLFYVQSRPTLFINANKVVLDRETLATESGDVYMAQYYEGSNSFLIHKLLGDLFDFEAIAKGLTVSDHLINISANEILDFGYPVVQDQETQLRLIRERDEVNGYFSSSVDDGDFGDEDDSCESGDDDGEQAPQADMSKVYAGCYQQIKLVWSNPVTRAILIDQFNASINSTRFNYIIKQIPDFSKVDDVDEYLRFLYSNRIMVTGGIIPVAM